MTASRALRPGTEIAAQTRERVRAAAEALGYRADPFLSTLVGYRTNLRRPRRHASLAYITHYPAGLNWKSWGSFGGYFRGAEQRAVELGYGLEEFSRRGIASNRRVEEILHHRGYSGLLIAPSLSPTGYTRIDIGRLPAVALGLSLRVPRLNYATTNMSRGMNDLLHHLKKLGYSRPGFATQRTHDSRNEHQASSAFLGWQAMFIPEKNRVPICVVPGETFPADLLKWQKKFHPDVIVSTEIWASQILQKAGLRFPDDTAFALMGGSATDSGPCAAMVTDYAGIGQAAVELLHAQILRGEKGVPAVPRGVQVDTVWHPGETVRSTPLPAR